MPAFPIAQVKNPQRSPLRLRFLTCTLRKAFCVIDPVICRTMYQNSFLDYLQLENMGIFTAAGKQNKSEEKLAELKAFGKSFV